MVNIYHVMLGLDTLTYCLGLGILILRTYAICHQSRLVLAILGLLALGPIIVMIVCDHNFVQSEVFTLLFCFKVEVAQESCANNARATALCVLKYDHEYFLLIHREQGWETICVYVLWQPNIYSGALILDVFILVFDTALITMTLHQTLGTLRLQRGLKHLHRNSLTRFLVQHDEFFVLSSCR